MYRFEKCGNNVVQIWSKCWEQCKEVKDHLERKKDTTERKIGNTMHKSKEVWKHNAQSSGNTNNRFEKCGNTMYNIKAKFGINVKEFGEKMYNLQEYLERRMYKLKGKLGHNTVHLQVNWTQDVKISREVWKHNVNMKIVYFTVFRTCTYPVSGGDWPFKDNSREKCTFKNL